MTMSGVRPLTKSDKGSDPVVATVVETEHLSKWYGQVIGLNDVTLKIGRGVTGLLGPNGAGKSTLLKVITGQMKPSKGSVRVLGEPVWGNPGIYLRMGVCPEQDAFYDRMTGHEWLTALLRLQGFGEREAADTARGALEQVDLTDAANKRIGAYSKGMRQRVKLAQAIAHAPELLVLDEPLSGMDPLARRKTIRLLRELGRRRPQRDRVEPRPARSGGAHLRHSADAPRPCAGGRQRSSDPRSHR